MSHWLIFLPWWGWIWSGGCCRESSTWRSEIASGWETLQRRAGPSAMPWLQGGAAGSIPEAAGQDDDCPGCRPGRVTTWALVDNWTEGWLTNDNPWWGFWFFLFNSIFQWLPTSIYFSTSHPFFGSSQSKRPGLCLGLGHTLMRSKGYVCSMYAVLCPLLSYVYTIQYYISSISDQCQYQSHTTTLKHKKI